MSVVPEISRCRCLGSGSVTHFSKFTFWRDSASGSTFKLVFRQSVLGEGPLWFLTKGSLYFGFLVTMVGRAALNFGGHIPGGIDSFGSSRTNSGGRDQTQTLMTVFKAWTDWNCYEKCRRQDGLKSVGFLLDDLALR